MRAINFLLHQRFWSIEVIELLLTCILYLELSSYNLNKDVIHFVMIFIDGVYNTSSIIIFLKFTYNMYFILLLFQRITDDQRGFRFVIQKRETRATILLKVYVGDVELYKTLKVTLYRESIPAEKIYTTKLDVYRLTADYNNGVLLQVPPIPVDKKTYSVQVESTVNQGNNGDRGQIHYFISNDTFKYIHVEYEFKPSSTEQHIQQTSIWTLIGFAILVIAIYYADGTYHFTNRKITPTTPVAGTAATAKQKQQQQQQQQQPTEGLDNNDIDLIVQSIYAVKRRPKPKKI